MTTEIAVAVGIVKNAHGEILIAKRPQDVHLGGLWEFPGGKVDPGEQPFEALIRELHEEIGIVVTKAQPLTTFPYQYPTLCVRLHVFSVESYQHTPFGKEGQELLWCAPEALKDHSMVEASTVIIEALQRRS